MKHKHKKDDELREALRSLLLDIEEMYEGAAISIESRDKEEFFGPFSVGKLNNKGVDAGISISWPNLAISMRNARNALRKLDEKGG